MKQVQRFRKTCILYHQVFAQAHTHSPHPTPTTSLSFHEHKTCCKTTHSYKQHQESSDPYSRQQLPHLSTPCPEALHIDIASIHCQQFISFPFLLNSTLFTFHPPPPNTQMNLLAKFTINSLITTLSPHLLIALFSLKHHYIWLPGHITLMIFLLPPLTTFQFHY